MKSVKKEVKGELVYGMFRKFEEKISKKVAKKVHFNILENMNKARNIRDIIYSKINMQLFDLD